MSVINNINRLAAYGLKSGLIEKEDLIFVKNQLLAALNIDGFETPEQAAEIPEVEISDLEDILKNLLDYAVEHKLTQGDGIAARDLFDTKLMSILTDRLSSFL